MLKILIGNSFPLSLVRRNVLIRPCQIEDLLKLLPGREIVSFWGHRNTLPAVSRRLGFDLTPAVERPALTLSPEKLPVFDGECYRECWILSPDYRPGFRPAIGEEVPLGEILGWQCLHLIFSDASAPE